MFTPASTEIIRNAFRAVAGPNTSMENANQLSDITISLAGHDARALVKRAFIERIKTACLRDNDNNSSLFTCDGNSYQISVFENATDGIIGVLVNRRQVLREGGPRYIPYYVEVAISSGCEGALGQAFETILNGEKCAVCGGLIQSGEVYCRTCMRTWNSTGCTVCGGQVGFLEGGKHLGCGE